MSAAPWLVCGACSRPVERGTFTAYHDACLPDRVRALERIIDETAKLLAGAELRARRLEAQLGLEPSASDAPLRRRDRNLYKARWARERRLAQLEKARQRELAMSRARRADPATAQHDKTVRNDRERYQRAVADHSPCSQCGSTKRGGHEKSRI